MSRRDLRISLDDATWRGLHALAEIYHATPERMVRSWAESEVATRLGQLLAGMPAELVVPSVGTFVEVPAPAEHRCWTIGGYRPPGTEESLTTSVMVASGELPPDLSFVARTMRRWSEHGALARGTAVARLGPADGAALGDPELTFRSGRRWTVRLVRPDASGRTGRGVLVEFDGAKVTGVEDLTSR
ncbi:hypothetical protein [Myceligenerans pegani]|uniref:Uncharacterized protein n=1 Tax=Myceligenerans pegani TaxID=2776917 RepID=A0ABR9N3F6_9MICO|nr:hypothetical protein [Myceligenerans sp. TRM 65318]MBE1878190.1 hypothetical protein [Myceligenerans sp. TRM 65318]MBE3020461.1 hypothetical protein [Myceligenerans sp. TRM 65318]